MKSKRVCMLLLVLGILVAGFVMYEIKNGFYISKAEAEATGGNILYVGGSGPGNYTTIQEAINDANDGDTIFVYGGVYYENVVINKRINLVGENKETTIIDGDHAGDVVNITVDGVSIERFTIRNSGIHPYAGVKIYFSSNNEIYNCNISNNNKGIRLWHSSNNSVYNCNITSNDEYGIMLYFCSNNSIYNCKITSNSWDGIGLGSSSNNNIYNCNITSNNGDGIGGTSNDNNSIYNCKISNNGYGIGLGSSSNNNIYNCNITSNDEHGIILYSSSSNNNSIYNCKISNNDYGIVLGSSNNNSIYNCKISNNDYGIRFEYSNNNSIYNCKISNNDYGIRFEYSNNNSIYNCNITSNDDYGIGLWCFSNNNSIYNCNISNNGDGVFAYLSSNNEIYNCNITSNDEYGIYAYYSSNNNLLYHNNFINNGQNAYDECNNQWDNDTIQEGNYWDDYTGTDADNDGIGDTPYYIPGESNVDHYPLMSPWGGNHGALPDLTIENIASNPTAPMVGQPVDFYVRIKNIGEGVANDAEILFVIRENFTTTDGDHQAGFYLCRVKPIPNLLTGEYTDVIFHWDNARPVLNTSMPPNVIHAKILIDNDADPSNNYYSEPLTLYDDSPFKSYPDGFGFKNWGWFSDKDEVRNIIYGFLLPSYGFLLPSPYNPAYIIANLLAPIVYEQLNRSHIPNNLTLLLHAPL